MFWSRNICLSLHQGSSESHKTLEKSLSMSALHPASLFFVFSHYHVSTDDIAPFSAYKHTHTTHNSSIHADEVLMLQISALKLLTVANLCYQFSW